MKRIIALFLTLCCIWGLVGCNAKLGNEHFAKIPTIMVDGKLFMDTGMECIDNFNDNADNNKITSTVKGWEFPIKNNQSNFGTGYKYQLGLAEGTINVYLNEKWFIFATEEVRESIQFPEQLPTQYVFEAIILEVHNKSYLVRPIEGSTELNSADKIEVPMINLNPAIEPEIGDVIEIIYNGEILETYPASLTEVFGIKVVKEAIQGGDTPIDKMFDISVSWANWTDDNKIYTQALNSEKMVINSVQHLPIYKFDTLEDLQQFKLDFGKTLDMENSHDEIPSFNDVSQKYDDEFFKEKTLMLIYVAANSGTYRYWANGIHCNGESFSIHIEQTNNPEIVTDDMAGWFITVVVPDSMISNCTEFTADLNNSALSELKPIKN